MIITKYYILYIIFIQTFTYEILFGVPNERDETTINQLNYIIMIGKHYIYCRKQKDKSLDMDQFLLKCKNRIHIMDEIINAAGN